MSTQTCHLSSLEIVEDEEVVILPVKYQHIREPSQLVYGSNSSCTLAHLPLFGKYDDFGMVKLNPESEENCTVFRTEINKNLMNNDENRKKVNEARYYFGDKFYIFKRKEYDEAEGFEFDSDASIIEKASDESNLLRISSISSNSELLELINARALLEIDGSDVNRFGYHLIKKSIYDNIIEDVYKETKIRVTEKIQNLLNTEVEDKEMIHFKIGESKLGRDTLELFNDDSYLIYKLIYPVRTMIECQVQSAQFNEGLLHWSLICRLYREIGKSFYPNVRRVASMKEIYAVNSIINKHIDERREANLKYWSPENGYDDEEKQRNEWNDWSQLY
ncbi:hypothetical protein [Vibrio sp. V15_P4S5T153]|uniref:hypothetical protein n=1 Tax=Vibrio sp. V15_P4S5T153 TaxID=1938669 RepID=UPI0011406E13|nr:hypothetical protein [Vibrio sp. V15_P4S5T153]